MREVRNNHAPQEEEPTTGEVHPESPPNEGIESPGERGRQRFEHPTLEQINLELRNELNEIFDGHKEHRERIGELLGKIRYFLEECKLVDGKTIQQELESLPAIDSGEEFVERVSMIIQPIVRVAASDREEYERAQRGRIIESEGFTRLNEMLAYQIDEDGWVYLHLPPSRTISAAGKISLFKDGLRQLAQIIAGDKNIKGVRASSWIVEERPDLVKKFGFTIDEESRGKESPPSSAFITKEELINKYARGNS